MKAQLETLGKGDGDTEKNIGNSSLAVSLLLQFLFYELRNRNAIKQWLYEKLSLEFDDLLTKTTTGKFFDAVKVNLTINFANISPSVSHRVWLFRVQLVLNRLFRL